MSSDKSWPTRLLTLAIILLATAPLWVWALDSVFHFGYSGD